MSAEAALSRVRRTAFSLSSRLTFSADDAPSDDFPSAVDKGDVLMCWSLVWDWAAGIRAGRSNFIRIFCII